jgi:hypothetical protein
MEETMSKALEVNDNTAQTQKRQPQRQSDDKRDDKGNEQKLQGKALQVNENSVEDKEPAAGSPAPRRNESAP